MESRYRLWHNGAPRMGAGRWKVKEGVEDDEKEEVMVLMGSKAGKEVRLVGWVWCGEERGERDSGGGESGGR